MKYKINFDKIRENTGRDFENIENLYFRCSLLLDRLRVNNKNYTKKQYFDVVELWEIFNAIEIQED